jgi:putative sigma-54 modulation protein
MKIEFTGRNVDVTPALRDHVTEKLGHSSAALESALDVHVVLAVEKYRHIAEIVVHRKRGSLAGRAVSHDMYHSIQKAVDRIETQLQRNREKFIGKKRRGSHGKDRADREALAHEHVPMTVPPPGEAATPRLFSEPLDRIKPIGVEEAILMLDEATRPFVAFRNAATGQVSVVYRRADGHYGVVEPRS